VSSVSAKVDMSAAAIEERLREIARLSPLTFEPLPRVSMSPEEVEARLRECAEMSAVCLELQTNAQP